MKLTGDVSCLIVQRDDGCHVSKEMGLLAVTKHGFLRVYTTKSVLETGSVKLFSFHNFIK